MRIKVTGYLTLDDGYAAGTGLSDAGYEILRHEWAIGELDELNVEVEGPVDPDAAPPADPAARPWYKCSCGRFSSQNKTAAEQHHNPDKNHKVSKVRA